VVVLVIGGGGREHALCYALQRSSSCDALFYAPRNASIADSRDATCISDLDINNSSMVISFCQRWGVGLVVVLVIGGGGREHALWHALQRPSHCDAVFRAPGNVVIADSGDATCISDLDINNSSVVISFCQRWGVGLVVVGPKAHLVDGLVDDLVKERIPTFSASSEAATLEG